MSNWYNSLNTIAVMGDQKNDFEFYRFWNAGLLCVILSSLVAGREIYNWTAADNPNDTVALLIMSAVIGTFPIWMTGILINVVHLVFGHWILKAMMIAVAIGGWFYANWLTSF